MLKSKSNFKKVRSDAFFSWKSDEFIVAMKCGNVHGAKGFTKVELQTLNFITDIEPRL
jgi:fructose/tagatose bisphosphate aldolase